MSQNTFMTLLWKESTSPTAVGNLVAIPHPMQLLRENIFDVLYT